MLLQGSCHCKAVRFTVESRTPYPYMCCYCSICRKTAGAAYAINIMGLADTLSVQGADALRIYRAPEADTASHEGQGLSPAHRHFCGSCGSFLWIADARWADWVYPFASAIDTPLPTPPERVHIMLEFKAPWVEVPESGRHFDRYPDESIAGWHDRHGITQPPLSEPSDDNA